MTKCTAVALLQKKYTPKCPTGTECRFVQITDKWAVKFYPTKTAMLGARKFQTKAAKLGLGPDVGGTVEYAGMFGYLTRMAQCLRPDEVAEGGIEGENLDCERSEFDGLIQSMKTIGYYINDFHYGNLGYYKNKLVNLDFGIREDESHCVFLSEWDDDEQN